MKYKKYILFLMLGICMATRLVGQELGPARLVPKGLTPLKEFKDKEEFVLKNFEVSNQRYTDAPLSVFLDDLEKEYPFLFILDCYEIPDSENFIPQVIILFYDMQEIRQKMAEGKEVWGVFLYLYSNIYENEPRFKAYEKAGLNKILKWNRRKYFDLLKDNMVDACSVSECSSFLHKYMKE